MTHVRIRVNREVVLDSDLDEWAAVPPDYFKSWIRPDANPQPWQKAVMVAMADAVLQQQDVSLEVTTEPNRWSMEVTNT